MMLASELPYVLEQINAKNVKGDVYTIDKEGNKVVLDFIYVDDDGDLIFTDYNKYHKINSCYKTTEEKIKND